MCFHDSLRMAKIALRRPMRHLIACEAESQYCGALDRLEGLRITLKPDGRKPNRCG